MPDFNNDVPKRSGKMATGKSFVSLLSDDWGSAGGGGGPLVAGGGPLAAGHGKFLTGPVDLFDYVQFDSDVYLPLPISKELNELTDVSRDDNAVSDLPTLTSSPDSWASWPDSIELGTSLLAASPAGPEYKPAETPCDVVIVKENSAPQPLVIEAMAESQAAVVFAEPFELQALPPKKSKTSSSIAAEKKRTKNRLSAQRYRQRQKLKKEAEKTTDVLAELRRDNGRLQRQADMLAEELRICSSLLTQLAACRAPSGTSPLPTAVGFEPAS